MKMARIVISNEHPCGVEGHAVFAVHRDLPESIGGGHTNDIIHVNHNAVSSRREHVYTPAVGDNLVNEILGRASRHACAVLGCR